MAKPTSKRGRGSPRNIASHNLSNDGDRGLPCRNELSEFFKIYLPALCSNSMRIPPAFLKKFGGNVPTNVTLRMPSGLSSQVQLHQIREHWFFQEGWPEFVLENSIVDGDFLIFSYCGDSVFSVKVFATNGCKKRFNKRSMIDEKPADNIKVEEASEPEPDDNDHNETTRRNVHQNFLRRRRSMDRNPSFSITQTKHYIERHYLNIPSPFWKAHMRRLEIGSETSATVCIKNNSWEVGLSVTIGRIRFSKGWYKFVQDNNLRPGNICAFELIDGTDLFFEATIHR